MSKKIERYLIRLRGQSISYALYDHFRGKQPMEVITNQAQQFDPRSSGTLQTIEYPVITDNQALTMYPFGKRVIPAMQILQPKFEVAIVASHFYCEIPYDPDLEIGHLNLKPHVVAVTPARIAKLESSLPIELKQTYLNYFYPETPAIKPKEVFHVTPKGVFATNWSTQIERQLITAIGLSFLDAETIDESEMDEEMYE